LLKSRGLTINDEQKALHYLGNISYYRLRAYTFPFQDRDDPDHTFTRNVSFEDIIDLYVFDRKLRLMIFDAIEKIEIAVRTQIIFNYSQTHGSHWHTDPSLYNNLTQFNDCNLTLKKEIGRSKEAFIEHYRKTYTSPAEPPCWMSLEVTSMGLMSKMFSNLRNDPVKDGIATYFGVKNVGVLENWLQCLSVIRNICAHHGRIWNRRMTILSFPKKPLNVFLNNRNIHMYKVYAYISVMQYLLNIISPGHSFKERLMELMEKCPLAQEKEMGFPDNWKEEPFWK
jgi:abortive infection bacteriophage resistance protein